MACSKWPLGRGKQHHLHAVATTRCVPLPATEKSGNPDAFMAAAKVDEDRRKQIEADCVAEAWRTGATSAITALGVAGAAVGGANYFFQGFRTSLGVSGKAALVVSPGEDFQLALCACQTQCSMQLLQMCNNLLSLMQVSPAFAMFWLYSELSLHECSQKKQFELLEQSRKGQPS